VLEKALKLPGFFVVAFLERGSYLCFIYAVLFQKYTTKYGFIIENAEPLPLDDVVPEYA